jgi:hypothetical protein
MYMHPVPQHGTREFSTRLLLFMSFVGEFPEQTNRS